MITNWTAGLEADKAKEITGDYLSARVLRKRMKELLEDKIESIRTDARKKVNYDKANWHEYMADSLGYERALNEVINMIFDKNEK